MTPRSISFVTPAFNERQSLPELFAELHAFAKTLTIPYEIVVVDDGSTDGSQAYLREQALTDARLHPIILRRNMGKASALQVGFQRARGEVIVTLDADLQNDPAEIPKLLEKIAAGADVVNGWKFDRPDNLEKRLPSKFFNAITRKVSGLQLHDFNSAIKAYTRTAAQSLVLYGELHRYIPILAHTQGFSVVEVPTHTRVRKYGETKYRGARYLRGFLDLLTVLFLTKYNRRPLHLFGGIGASMTFLGSVILLYLVGVKVFTGAAIGTRPLLTFGIFFALVGLQLIFTGLLAELLVRSVDRDSVPVRDEWNGDGELV